MLKSVLRNWLIEPLSIAAMEKIARADKGLWEMWNRSLEIMPDLNDHFTAKVVKREVLQRIRLLIVAEALFIKEEIETILHSGGGCSLADVGDSDGSVRLLLRTYFPSERLQTIGVNLQKAAVEKMKARGLDAICADANDLCKQNKSFDVVSLFETLEHLPDPIGFLGGIGKLTDKRLIISVPFIRRSRVGLYYTEERENGNRRPTIENTHIFELSPRDWRKVFAHAGWAVARDRVLLMYPSFGVSRAVLQPFWRYVSFEGFWFVSLSKNNSIASRYVVE